jgi:hypothetical protein
MGKLKSRYRKGDKLLKIFETERNTGGWLRGVLYQFKWDTSVSPNKCYLSKLSAANFYEKDGDMNEFRVQEYFGMTGARFVKGDGYIDYDHRVIWTNDDYDEWERCMKIDYPDGVDEDGEEIDLSEERYYEDCNQYLYDERANLDVEVDGVIVAFGVLGLWDGNHNAACTFGNKVKNILKSECDYLDWYCDRYNVRCRASHHDGTNHYLYRVAKDREQAKRLVDAIAYEGMTEEQFRKSTKSLRPYVAKVYGW